MGMSAEPERGRPVAAINVTPMADVMIVLLIIFMVTAPMFGRDDHVRLPDARNGSSASRPTPRSPTPGWPRYSMRATRPERKSFSW